VTPLQTRIIGALHSVPDGLTPVEIGQRTGDDPRAVYASMSGMRRSQNRHWVAAPQHRRPSRRSKWMLTYKGAVNGGF
jgi:hypothetical protein